MIIRRQAGCIDGRRWRAYAVYVPWAWGVAVFTGAPFTGPDRQVVEAQLASALLAEQPAKSVSFDWQPEYKTAEELAAWLERYTDEAARPVQLSLWGELELGR